MTKEWLKENLSFFEYSNVFEILDRGFEATAGCGLFSSFFFVFVLFLFDGNSNTMLKLLKFKNFSTFEIFREINLGKSRISKNCNFLSI